MKHLPGGWWLRAGLAVTLVAAFTIFASSNDMVGTDHVTGPVDIKVEPWNFAQDADGRVAPGLYWRGGLRLVSDDPRFGGFSGLALSKDGSRLLAVSDEGWWFTAQLLYDGKGLASLADPFMAPLLDEDGKRPASKRRRDAEALALLVPGVLDGEVAVGFETKPRIELYDLKSSKLAAIPQLAPSPPAIRNGPRNKELEALAFVTGGPLANSFIAVSELQLDEQGNIIGWVFGPGRKSWSFAIARLTNYAVTDIALLPDGDLLLLERSFSAGFFPGTALRRIPIAQLKPNAVVTPNLVFEGRLPRFAIDNMEGLAVHVTPAGETRITLISDDNYMRSIQDTILLQFALMREPD